MKSRSLGIKKSDEVSCAVVDGMLQALEAELRHLEPRLRYFDLK